MITTFLLLLVQCTWTPEVTTLIHRSEKGSVALLTSSHFKIPPQHPHVFSESLIKQILQELSQDKKQGLLQELFFSNPIPSPVFSPAQIEFMTPHIVEAFSKATSEEFVTFRIPGNEEGVSPANGMIAVFSPTIFFLTLKKAENYPANSSKIASSSRNIQKHTTLMFSQKQAMLQQKDAQRLIKIPSKDLWIAIDYATLNPAMDSEHKIEGRPRVPITTPQSDETQPELNILQEQVQDLRKRVNDQAEEIRRLRQTSPK